MRLLATLLAFAVAGPVLAQELPSPTGRSPQFLWTPARQYQYQRMKDQNHWLWQGMLATCEATGTSGQRYGDSALHCAWMYQVTANTTYAQKAYTLWLSITNYGANWPSGNTVRESFTERVLVLDWIWPSLTPQQRTASISAIKRWGDFAVANGTPQYMGDFALPDSDATTGYYFGLAALDLFDVPENTTKGTWLNRTTRNGTKIGGLDPTGTGTARDALAGYVLKAPGGEWIESSAYNLGTLTLLFLGWASVETTAPGHFPEIQGWLLPGAAWSAMAITPDLKGYNQWGDEEHPHIGLVYRHWRRDAMLAGLSGDAVLQRLTLDVEATQRTALQANIGLIARVALLWNPEQPGALAYPWTTVRTASSNAVGHVAVKNSDTLAVLAAPPRLSVHHDRTQTPSFKLYRDGEWALNHPLGYGAIPVGSMAVNGILLAGLNVMYDRQNPRYESGADWWALTGSTQGSYYDAKYYQPPPAFVTKAQRSIIYFRDGIFDVFVVRDSIAAQDPTKLPRFDRYRAADKATITAALARTGGTTKELIFHAPGPPTLEAGRMRWTTAGGKEVTIQHVAPIAPVRTVYNETEFLVSGFQAAEVTGKHIRLWAPSVQDEDEFVNVVFVGNGPTPTVKVIPKGLEVGSKAITFLEDRIVVQPACTCP